MPIIKSLLDNDLYKFTMQWAVLESCRHVPMKGVFSNRRKEGKFHDRFLKRFNEEVDAMGELRADDNEINAFAKACPFLPDQYMEYIRNFRYDPRVIKATVANNEFALDYNGFWEREILWEVPLMSIISELYFEECDTDWTFDEETQKNLILQKANTLADLNFADFGTRRRRSYRTQDLVVREFAKLTGSNVKLGKVNFVGTSNVHLALKYGTKPIGTMAHEWIMGISALEGLRYANRHAMEAWARVYNGDLGTALTDTFGSDNFFNTIDMRLAKLYDSVRHDSGDPIEYAHKAIAFYKKHGIDPMTKTIVFSDGLTCASAAQIARDLEGLIKVAFGIGTHFTNDFGASKALNMVIKMAMCNGVPVVKLSDTLTKAIGDPDALRVAKWMFFGTPLDA